MSGIHNTLDKLENSSLKNPLADPSFKMFAKGKEKYGDSRGIDTSQGYALGKEKKAIDQANTDAANAATAAEAAHQEARNVPTPNDDAAALAAKKDYAMRRRRSGRMSTVLTGDTLG